MFAGKYGAIAFIVTRFTDAGDGRDWVLQSPAIGDQHVLQDRGTPARRTACEILFCDEPRAGGTYLERFLAFRELARGSTLQVFQHPIHGAYEAAATEPQYEVDAGERCVRVTCTFLASEEPQPVSPVGSGVVAAAGPEAVSVRATAATSALGVIGVVATAPAACVAAVQSWADAAEPDARAIAVEAASLAAQIDEQLDGLVSLASWPAYKALIMLRRTMTLAADAVTSETQRVTQVTLEAAEPLLSLCARFYPPREAQERARQVAKLNGLRTPGLVPAGTTIKMPVTR